LKRSLCALSISVLSFCPSFCFSQISDSMIPGSVFARRTETVSSGHPMLCEASHLVPAATESTGSPAPKHADETQTSPPIDRTRLGSSVYIPVDSWIYPEVLRLYSLGYGNTLFLSVRPWTRLSLLHALDEAAPAIREGSNEEAKKILIAVQDELSPEVSQRTDSKGTLYGIDSVYTRALGISDTSLRDSFHLGQTIVNDFGRPYQGGFNLVTGASGLVEHGHFSLYVRGEYQHSPSAMGYSEDLANELSQLDIMGPFSAPNAPQSTIPSGPIVSQNRFNLLEATISVNVLGHEISGGKSDAWLGPGRGGAMAWSNNAENLYSFRINRVDPLHIPLVSRVLGPLRYDFIYGSLKGHTDPNNPYMHMELFSFRPTQNFEFTFIRTVIFGGKGHEAVTLHNFLRSFFSLSDVSVAQKNSGSDPGARFSDFSFSYRVPFVRHFATLYVDSIAHDDVSPISAPRRAAFRTGLELSQIPRLNQLELRVEAVTTDPPVSVSSKGTFNYWENVQRQGYTNNGFIIGDWIGREAKGGQAWLTYHTSAINSIELAYLNKKTPKDFIAGGTTQNQIRLGVSHKLKNDLLMNASIQYERWKAPIYQPGPHSDTSTNFQLTYSPHLHGSSSH